MKGISLNEHYLFVIPTDTLGGAEQLIKNMAIELKKRGKNVSVACLTNRTLRDGWGDIIDIVNFQKTSNIYWGLILFVFRIKKYAKVSCCFSSQIYINGTLGILRKFKWFTPEVLIVRESTSVFLRFSGIKRKLYLFFYLTGYKYANKIICQTRGMKNQLINNIKKALKWNIKVVQNPVSLDNIFKLANKESEFKFCDNYIISAGRFIPEKGFDILISAFAECKMKYRDRFRDIKLIIFGEGKERKNLETLIENLKLEDQIFLPGYCKNPFPYFKNAVLCVVSSRTEGFPNVLLQMMALNEKVISTRCAYGIDKLPGISSCEIENVEELAITIIKGLNYTIKDEELKSQKEFLKNNSIQQYVDKTIFS